jgi:hypothetical protein
MNIWAELQILLNTIIQKEMQMLLIHRYTWSLDLPLRKLMKYILGKPEIANINDNHQWQLNVHL